MKNDARGEALNFTESEEHISLKEIATQYHESCDLHDDKVLTGKNKYGESLPANSFERKQMLDYSRDQLKIAVRRAAKIGFTESELRRAIKQGEER